MKINKTTFTWTPNSYWESSLMIGLSLLLTVFSGWTQDNWDWCTLAPPTTPLEVCVIIDTEIYSDSVVYAAVDRANFDVARITALDSLFVPLPERAQEEVAPASTPQQVCCGDGGVEWRFEYRNKQLLSGAISEEAWFKQITAEAQGAVEGATWVVAGFVVKLVLRGGRWILLAKKSGQAGSAAKGVGNISKSIHLGKQGKHILGHNNFQAGKSILNSSPQKLLDDFHAGKFKTLRTFDNKVIVDFGTDIGTFYKGGKPVGPTRFGIIHHGKDGAHIVPANPIQF